MFAKLIIINSLLFISFVLFANNPEPSHLSITVGKDLYEKNLIDKPWAHANYYFNDIVLLNVPKNKLKTISLMAHKYYNRCGGFILETDTNMLISSLHNMNTFANHKKESYPKLTHAKTITPRLNMVSEKRIHDHIKEMSAFKNRYYKTQQGVSSQKWLFKKWQQIANNHPNVDISYFRHSQYPQASVIATIKGSSLANEHLIIGGHGDSIAGWFPSENTHAPGADDNASGIAVITEVFKLLIDTKHIPKRSIQFISYAAEEVGLRGSTDIATTYKNQGKRIKGVLQFDMTNFAGDANQIVLIDDYTTSTQNDYLIQLINHYLPGITWARDKCGYACSDHVSWFRAGYPVSFPFESSFSSHNKNIHSAHDTLGSMNQSAQHSVPFAKLALAYLLELSS